MADHTALQNNPRSFATHKIAPQTCPSTSIVFVLVKFGAELLEPVVSVDTFSYK